MTPINQVRFIVLSNKKGILGAIWIVAIVVGLSAVGGFIWWRVASSDAPAEETTSETVTEEETSSEETATEEIIVSDEPNTEVVEVENISLVYPDDVSKLPDGTPASYLSYMRGLLGESEVDEYGCIASYYVNKISQVNIAGGASSVSVDPTADEFGCGGGAAMYWYLKDGNWDKLGTQDIIPCTTLTETTLYQEFVDVCYEDATEANSTIANPNGSIVDADF